MNRNIPVIIPYFTDSEAQEISKVIQSGWVAQGPKVAEFERKIADHEQVKFATAVTSCTTALHLLMACMGLGKGHDVLVPSFTFVATANSVEYTGATPVLVDVRTDTYNIDVEALGSFIEANYRLDGKQAINRKTGNILFAAVAVNLFGLCADIPAINALAAKYGFKVIEDSACALGAKIGNTFEGGFGNPSCLSFHPRKSITTGEGGMVLTNDPLLDEKLKERRAHGASVPADKRHLHAGYLLPEFDELGYNYRMTDVQAAMGVAQMEKFEFILGERRKRAALYDKLLAGLPFIKTPFVPQDYLHTYQSYVCILNNEHLGQKDIGAYRNRLLGELDAIGIATRQGTHAVHSLGYYANKYGYKPQDLPNALYCQEATITLPLYIQMTDDDQNYVVEKLCELQKKL